MSQVKAKAEILYNKLRSDREKLVKKYEANGTIRYDVACGLAFMSTAAGTTNATATTARTRTVPHFRENETTAITGATTRTVINFDGPAQGTVLSVKDFNQSQGIPSGTMIDAFRARASGKVVELYANDQCLRWGMIILADVPCMLRIMDDINSFHASIAPTFTGAVSGLAGAPVVDPNVRGLVHSLPGKVEIQAVTHRGLFKPHNYRGDADLLKNPISLWSHADKSRQSTSLLGVNSLIRMWGKDQVIDLAGRTVDVHERPNQFAAFSVIVDLSDSHFAGLSTKGAQNAHIFSSTGLGRLGRNNHFAIRGHFCRRVLVEGIQSGDQTAKNKGSYFGTAIFNDSSEIIFKDVHQEQLNHHVPRSSLGLSWYADLTVNEILFAKLETTTTWGTGANYPWLKWETGIPDGQASDIFGNGRKTLYPIIKSVAELEAAGLSNTNATEVRNLLIAAQEAYRASAKNADDVYTQINVGHGANFVPLTNGRVERAEQMSRTTNLVVANPLNRSEGNMYPDSVSYGFRAGSTSEGVGNLASARGGTAQEVYLIDCSFQKMALSMMEAVSIASDSFGLMKSFNGQALRPLGYSNSRNPVAGIAAASMHVSQAKLAELFSKSDSTKVSPPSSPFVDSDLDTASKAFANTNAATSNQAAYTTNTYVTAKDVNGLYKGHDILEASLATLTAVGRLAKHFTAAGPAATLSGLNNSNTDIGILAWRYSMMQALGADTACHVGLKGGYQGDLLDRTMATPNVTNDGELYPWFRSSAKTGSARLDGTQASTTIVDKDSDYVAAAADPDRNREVITTGYLACPLPEPTDALFKFEFELVDPTNEFGGVQMKLVHADSGDAVTYGECATLLGFDALGLNKMDSAAECVYNLVENLDGQNHVHKGQFGIRFDQITDCGAIRCRVNALENGGFAPEVRMIASKETSEALGTTDPLRPGSKVNDAHGVSINGVTNCYLEDIEVTDLLTLGDVHGVEIQGQSKNVEVNGAKFTGLHAGEIYPGADAFSLSNKIGRYYNVGPQKSIGVRVSSNCTDVVVKNIVASEVTSPAPENAKPASLEIAPK